MVGVGPYSIPTKVLRLLKNGISSQLSEIFNISFSSGVFPSILKTVKVISVQNDSKPDFSNYCPVSLLFNIENFLERLMYNSFYKFFSDSNRIYSLQFGFRQKYSTLHALISLIRKSLDEEIIGCGIFVDLQKAFEILLNMIFFYESLNIMVCVVLLMNCLNLLSYRKQYVLINDSDSNLDHKKFGVPEVSVLGPPLFLILTNDLSQALKLCKVHHFADDTDLLHFSKSVNRLNKYVNLDLKKSYLLVKCQPNFTEFEEN